MRKVISVLTLLVLIAIPAMAQSTTDSQTDDYYYVVTFECSQSHFTLDITEHLKDSMNKLTFEVPVDKDYYNKLSVGDTLTDSFRMGSLIMKGSIGKWKVKIVDKRKVRK